MPIFSFSAIFLFPQFLVKYLRNRSGNKENTRNVSSDRSMGKTQPRKKTTKAKLPKQSKCSNERKKKSLKLPYFYSFHCLLVEVFTEIKNLELSWSFSNQNLVSKK